MMMAPTAPKAIATVSSNLARGFVIGSCERPGGDSQSRAIEVSRFGV
jgi:hypothetical protein